MTVNDTYKKQNKCNSEDEKPFITSNSENYTDMFNVISKDTFWHFGGLSPHLNDKVTSCN